MNPSLFLAVNTLLWLAQAVMDIQRKQVQTLYIVPAALSSILVFNSLSLTTPALLALVPILESTGYFAKGDTYLLATYLFSTSLQPVIGFTALSLIGGTYILLLQEIFDMGDHIPMAPAFLISFTATYVLGFAL